MNSIMWCIYDSYQIIDGFKISYLSGAYRLIRDVNTYKSLILKCKINIFSPSILSFTYKEINI